VRRGAIYALLVTIGVGGSGFSRAIAADGQAVPAIAGTPVFAPTGRPAPELAEHAGSSVLHHSSQERPPAEARGVTFELYYSSDFLVNARGGLDTSGAFQYRGLMEFAVTIETEPLGLWHGGTLFINFINNHGLDISERYIGDLQAVNNADGPNDSRLYEFWYQQQVLDESARLKFGKMDVNSDFAAGMYRSEFMHSSAGYSPTMPIITWPDTALGVAVFIEPMDWFYIGAGVYDARGFGTRPGFDTAFHAPNESLTIVESGVRPALSLFGQDELPGQYAVGGYYHSGRWERYTDDPATDESPSVRTGNEGVYLTADQLLFREESDEGSDGRQGLGVFFQFGWSPSNRNEISHHFGGGFQYHGPIPSRDEDILGFGVHYANISREIRAREQRGAETVFELFYMAQVTDWLSVKPDVQYILDPGGDGRDALVAGVRMEFAILQ
jgi:porin